MSLLEKERHFAIQALSSYWLANEQLILDLPIAKAKTFDSELLPPQLETVVLPEWAKEISVNRGLLVPSHFIAPGEGPRWALTDWIGAIFWYLNGVAERAFESRYGPIHSYASRLTGWDSRIWQWAWVNRMALFLRLWAARQKGWDEETLFGPLPEAEIILTHDVDAVIKTRATRLKQTVFRALTSWRSLLQGKVKTSVRQIFEAGRLTFRSDDYWCFDRITAIEELKGLRSCFFVYAGAGGWRRPPKQLLLDPSYEVSESRLKNQLRRMRDAGWQVGLHQSFNAWADPELMREERVRLERVLNGPVSSCRQHWLRFSWERTWKAQEAAGLSLDCTLGFNDRPAFRSGAALRYKPWDPRACRPMSLKAIPLVLMDSHLYDYVDLTDVRRWEQISHWLEEIFLVHGTASMLWHQRIMSADYGLGPDYERLIQEIAGKA